MQRMFVLVCASLAYGLSASPLTAQDMAHAPPQTAQLPPPPPFPPMPSSKPSHRFVDVGGRHASRARSKASPARHASSPRHAASATRGSKAHARKTASNDHRTTKHRATASHRVARTDKPMHFSAKTIRSCHAMTYRQIMRSSSCRTMIKQELAASAHKDRASGKTSAKHKAAMRSKKARSHSALKRHRR